MLNRATRLSTSSPRPSTPCWYLLASPPGQSGAADGHGQVIFCRGDIESADDGCVDLVLDLDDSSGWHVVDVRYWGFPSDRWHLKFDRHADLPEQLSRLAQNLPDQLLDQP